MRGDDRAEDLLAHGGRVGVDVGQQRRLDEVAAELGVGAAAAGRRGALRQRGLEDAGDLLELLRVGQRAHLGGGLERVAEDDLARPRRDPLDQLVMDVLVDDQPRTGHAGLPGGREDAGDDAVRGRFEVGVPEDDLRGLAAELERHPREVAGRALGDVDAGLGRAGERDLVDARVAHERAPDRRPVAGDDVEHAVGDARLGHELGQLERGHGRVVARLDDHRAAGGERGRELPGQQQQRRVPRHDGGHHADRHALRERDEVGLVGRDALARELVGPAGEVAVPRREQPHLSAELAQQLARVARLELGQAVGVALDQVGEAMHQPRALEAGERSPLALERRARGGHGAVDVRLARVRHPRPGLPGVGIDGLVEAALGGWHAPARDVELVLREFDGGHSPKTTPAGT